MKNLTRLSMLSTASALVALAAPAYADNQDCTIVVPANPLTAQGLATPYQLKATNPADGPCNELTADQSAFVQATIYDPTHHTLSVYNPLVIDAGTTPQVAPVVPTLPAGAIVGLWFGSNGTILRQQGATSTTLAGAHCINGLPGSPFGQVSACNAVAFFAATKADLFTGALIAPPLGTAIDGKPCPTVRDFMVVDQDQSDNVTGTYLSINGQLMQNNATNAAAYPTATLVKNGSDNRLLTALIDKGMSCTPWMAPDLGNGGALTTSQAMDELHAQKWQQSPIALVPLGDEMVLNNNHPSIKKMNLYRSIVGQTPYINADTDHYCYQIQQHASRVLANQANFVGLPAADPAVGSNLFTFLCGRAAGTWQVLGCATKFHVQFPYNVTYDANGVATACSGVTLGAGSAGSAAGSSEDSDGTCHL